MNLKKYLTKKNQSDVDKLDVGKFKTTLNLSKLSDVVKNEVVKKTVYDEVIKKVNAIQTTDANNLVKRSDYDTKMLKLKRKYWIMIMINILLHKNL